jgi:hypothetical protein
MVVCVLRILIVPVTSAMKDFANLDVLIKFLAYFVMEMLVHRIQIVLIIFV